MSLITELTLRKTAGGYRVFRKPLEALSTLRNTKETVVLNGEFKAPSPLEITFSTAENLEIHIGNEFLSYDRESGTVKTSSGAEYRIETSGTLNFRIFADTRSVEIFINDEIGATFFNDSKSTPIIFTCASPLDATVYTLKSIW